MVSLSFNIENPFKKDTVHSSKKPEEDQRRSHMISEITDIISGQHRAG